MDKARCKGIYLNIMRHELVEVALRHQIGKLVVRDAGHDEADIHTAFRGQTQRLEHGLVDSQVGCGDIHLPPGAADHLEEQILRRVVRVVIGAVHHCLAEALLQGVVQGAIIVVLMVQLTVHPLPHLQELPGQAPGALALQPETAVLPIAEAFDQVGVLVGDIGAAGVGNISIHAGDLPVVAVVEVQPVDVVVHGVEYPDLHPSVLQRVYFFVGHTHHAAEIIKDQLDLYALTALAAEDIRQPIPYLAFGHDKVLQEDEPLGRIQCGEHILQIRLTGGQIAQRRVAVQVKALAAEIRCQRIPLGRGLAQLFQIGAGELLLRQRLLDGHRLLQAQALGRPVAVPQQIEDQPHHRHEQHQNDPAHLITGGPGAGPDTHGHHTGQQLQYRIGQRHALLEQVAEADHQRDLRQKQHRHHHQPQGGGYTALCSLLYLWLSHGGSSSPRRFYC